MRREEGAHLLPLPLAVATAVSCRGTFRSGVGRIYPGAMQAAGGGGGGGAACSVRVRLCLLLL